MSGGRDFIKSGDTWTVQQILPDGDVLVRHTQHRGRIRLPADYLAARCDLGYASTVRRAAATPGQLSAQYADVTERATTAG
ncbi:hypothetical protein [Streptomyces sp. Ru62]|uniref:hypothetical protein n=1 Tax=Streptomyces sp. Ru62 TaxID=2080745 RepID=UPI0011B09104|nr:hypothetical protein [Streptomyces sp. Ru62]